MAGRKPTPTALKKLAGNPGKRPLPENEPQPPQGDVQPPSFLSPKAKYLWREIKPILEDMGVLTVADRTALTLLCDVYCEWRDARDVVLKEGPTYTSETRDGGYMVRPRPEVAIRSDAWKRLKAMLSEFGLTSASRTKLAANLPEKDVDPLDEYLKANQRN